MMTEQNRYPYIFYKTLLSLKAIGDLIGKHTRIHVGEKNYYTTSMFSAFKL